MRSIVDPSSDALWDSVEIVATVEGTVHKMPKSDEEWAVLRRSAVTLVEAGNLLLHSRPARGTAWRTGGRPAIRSES